MARSALSLSVLIAGLLAGASNARGASHAEITPVIIGSAAFERGSHTVSYRLPRNTSGVLPQALVVIGAQPSVEVPNTAPPAPGAAPTLKKVPAEIAFGVGGKPMPPWKLTPHPTAYVINLDAVRANPDYKSGTIRMNVNTTTTAEQVGVVLLGMPDPAVLLHGSGSGALADLAENAKDPDVKAYWQALAMEIAGDEAPAREAYTSLRNAKNRDVARFARRGLRMLSYKLRKRKLSGDFMEHRRWGLYLQECGLFAVARSEFEECRILEPSDVESQYRCGALHDRLRSQVLDVNDYMNRAGEASAVADPVDWHVLFILMKSRSYNAEEDDKTVKKVKSLTDAERIDIKNRWLVVESMVWAATRGKLRLITSFYELDDEDQRPYVMHGGKVLGPPDDIIERRGWFDGVISVRPRLPSEEGRPNRTVGGDLGPNGAALSDLFHDTSWRGFLEHWHRQFSWAVAGCEPGPGYPLGDEAADCGHKPVPYLGFGCREALHAYLTPAMCRRVDAVDVGVPGTHVRFWRVEGPYPVNAQPPPAGRPGHHVMDPIPAGTPERAVAVDSNADFIDLAAVLPDAGWARAVAKTWVYCPADREVRMWIGQNDGAAVWINGRCVHQGRRYSAGKYADRNLVDTVASYAPLKKGWNAVRVVVESWPTAKFDKRWGFSIRFCTWNNRPLPGLAYLNTRPAEDIVMQNARPPVGPFYSWRTVRDRYHDTLPQLTESDLRTITGVSDLRLHGEIIHGGGFFALSAGDRTDSRTCRAVPSSWDREKDRDIVLNNLLDWDREHCAAFPFSRQDRDRDLLFLRPEAIDAYLTLLDEPRPAEVGPATGPAGRVLGYVIVPGAESDRTLLVVEANLGNPTGWPLDEEDLLRPPLD